MAFPKLLKKLFQSDGTGDLLNESLIPSEYLKVGAQTFSDTQKQQARDNIGAIAYADLPSLYLGSPPMGV